MNKSEFLKKIQSYEDVSIIWMDEKHFDVATKDADGNWWGLVNVRFYLYEGVEQSIYDQVKKCPPTRLKPKFGINGFEEA